MVYLNINPNVNVPGLEEMLDDAIEHLKTTGQEVQDLVTKMYATPKPVVDRLIKAMKQP